MEEEFQRIVGRLDYPLYIVTAAAGEERDGCLVGFATQCSIHPPLYFVCISVKNRTHDIAVKAQTLGVHVASRKRRDLAEWFGGETGDERDKLARVEWSEGPGGAPIVAGLPDWFVGEVRQRVDYGGDHTGFVLEPVAAAAGGDGDQLGFQEAKGIEPGHEP